MQGTNETQKNRIYYLDFLRITSIFSVIVLHTAAYNIEHVEPGSFDWMVFNCYDGLVRWSVPVLVMISGTLFLSENKQVTLSSLHSKYIRRIVTAFFFWSTIYAYVDIKCGNNDISSFVITIFKGHYHLWFLFMLIGLYLIIPLLRQITSSQLYIRYFLVLSVIFTFVLPTAIDVLKYGHSVFNVELAYSLKDIVESILSDMKFYFTLGYVAYFVGGYYLNKIEICRKIEFIIYACGITGYILTIFASLIVTSHYGSHHDFYGNNQIGVMFEALAVFTFGKCRISKWFYNCKRLHILDYLSNASFGIYLVHALVLEQFARIVFDTTFINPILSVPIIAVIVLLISAAISFILNRIPIVNKYFV